MKALSIRQPWAWLICKGYKDVENRPWRTEFRGRVYVHTGKRFDKDCMEELMDALNYHFPDGEAYQAAYNLLFDIPVSAYPLGCIIGEVDITGCVTKNDSPWFTGPYGFILANPVLYVSPIPYKGRLGFFTPEVKFTP